MLRDWFDMTDDDKSLYLNLHDGKIVIVIDQRNIRKQDRKLKLYMQNNIFVMNSDDSCMRLLQMVRARLKSDIKESEAIFLITRDSKVMCTSSKSVNEVFREHSDKIDHVVYLNLFKEDVFG